MSTSTSRLAFEDCYIILDKALERPLRLGFGTEGAARHFRTRLHAARTLDRQANAETYPRGEPMHGLSQYDKVVVRIRKDEKKWWIYLEPVAPPAVVEELDLVEGSVKATESEKPTAPEIDGFVRRI